MQKPRPLVPVARDDPDEFPMLGTVQRRVQFVVLLQLAEDGTADLAATAAICPRADERDLQVALQNLLDQDSIEVSLQPRGNSLVDLAAAGLLTLTALGRLRLEEEDV